MSTWEGSVCWAEETAGAKVWGRHVAPLLKPVTREGRRRGGRVGDGWAEMSELTGCVPWDAHCHQQGQALPCGETGAMGEFWVKEWMWPDRIAPAAAGRMVCRLAGAVIPLKRPLQVFRWEMRRCWCQEKRWCKRIDFWSISEVESVTLCNWKNELTLSEERKTVRMICFRRNIWVDSFGQVEWRWQAGSWTFGSRSNSRLEM